MAVLRLLVNGQWVDLPAIKGDKGDKGDQGIPGIQGIQGIQGVQGPKGETGPQGATGPQGEQGLQGIEGPQGPQGIQGPQGDSGVYIGTTEPQDANVWIDPSEEPNESYATIEYVNNLIGGIENGTY